MSSSSPDLSNHLHVYTRPIWQIALKTTVTHILALIIYNQYNNLLHVPTKHNGRLFRLIVFTFMPTVLLGQFAFDIAKAAKRALQNPHELDLNSNEAKHSFRFYWDSILGARAISSTESEAEGRAETTRLLDVSSPSNVQPEKTSDSTAKRIGQIGFSILAIAQAALVVLFFVRRALHQECEEFETPCVDSPWHQCEAPMQKYYRCYDSMTTVDVRNVYMACTSIIAALLSVYLLAAGTTWTTHPILGQSEEENNISTTHTSGVQQVMGEMKRLSLDFIIGALIQEFVAVKTYFGADGAPQYLTCLMNTIHRMRLDASEIILFVLVFGMLAIFRNDIASRLGIKLGVIYAVLMAVVAGWLVIDTIALAVSDVVHVIVGEFWMEWDQGGRWMDPWEWLVPFA